MFDTLGKAFLEYSLLCPVIPFLARNPEDLTVSLVKIIVITIIVILSIIFFGRFFI